MTRTEARMIAEELGKILSKDIARVVKSATVTATDKQLSAKEAADYLGWSVKTVYNKIADIPHYKVGKKLRFSEIALADYIRTR